MDVYAHRVETTLTDDQFQSLTAIAEQRGRSIEDLVREAIVQTYLTDLGLSQRLAALDRLASLEVPKEAWPEPLAAPVVTGMSPARERMGIALIDADVPIHAVIPESPARVACAWIIEEIAHGRLTVGMDASLPTEIIDRLARVGERAIAHELIESLMQIIPIQFPVDARDIQLAADLCRMREASQLRSGGCIRLAVMQRHGLAGVVSMDRAYDAFPDVVRIDPRTLYAH
ncbi:MAG: hypothetical protein Kow0047_21620 [Anaerolineae bacterium]